MMVSDYTADADELSDEERATTYYLDGRPLEDDEVSALFDEIRPWLPERDDNSGWKTSATQAAAGVDEYAHQQYRSVPLSSVYRIIMERNEYIFDK